MKARARNSQVKAEKTTDARAPAARNSESQEIKPCVLKQWWQTNTLVWKEKVIKLEKHFENNLDKTQGEILFAVPKTDFGKLTRNRARAEVHTLLSGLGDCRAPFTAQREECGFCHLPCFEKVVHFHLSACNIPECGRRRRVTWVFTNTWSLCKGDICLWEGWRWK